MEENTQEPLIDLNVDYDAGNILSETIRWSKLISVLGIFGVGLMLLIVIFGGNAIIYAITTRYMPGSESFRGLIIFAVALGIALLGLMVSLLYRFSTLVKKGIDMHDQFSFNKGLNALKVYFMISGILAIISLLSNIGNLFKI